METDIANFLMRINAKELKEIYDYINSIYLKIKSSIFTKELSI